VTDVLSLFVIYLWGSSVVLYALSAPAHLARANFDITLTIYTEPFSGCLDTSVASVDHLLHVTPSSCDMVADTDHADDTSLLAIPIVGQEHKRSFGPGRPLVTAGNIVAVVAFVIAGAEIALFALVLQL
jgi:hypothetical protein